MSSELLKKRLMYAQHSNPVAYAVAYKQTERTFKLLDKNLKKLLVREDIFTLKFLL